MPSVNELQPWLRPYARWLLDVATYNHIPYVITSVYRSPAEQQALYDRWRSGQSPLPAAPPGRSQHGYRLAFDVVFDGDYRSERQRQLGALWQRMGGLWGGSRDPVHFAVK